jgi:hypothetical protein
MVSPIGIRVECYSGYRGEETPQVVHLKDRRVLVAEIIDRWLAPDHRYFKFRGDDGSLYIIRHDVVAYEWQMIFFQDRSMKDAAASTSLSGKA